MDKSSSEYLGESSTNRQCGSPPPMIVLWFLKEKPSRMWEDCTKYLKEWKSYDLTEMERAMVVAKLVWQSNLLEDTIPKYLEEKETVSHLARMYCQDALASTATGNNKDLLQLEQHLQAFKLLTSNLTNDLTEDLIKESHKIMMKGLQNEQGIPVTNGSYRQGAVHAGFHQFPSHECIPRSMTRIVEIYNQRKSTSSHDPYELASWLHYEVVSLHPFEDGNGRLSRLLWSYSLMKDGLPFPPVLTSGHKKSQKHLVKCLKRDRDCFYSRHPHMTTLTVVSVSLAWKEFLSKLQKEQPRSCTVF